MPAAYRADHVGSLLRPPELLDARASHAAGSVSDGQLKELEDRCILQALEVQRSCGVQVMSDGEYRRGCFRTELANALDGMDLVDAPLRARKLPRRRCGLLAVHCDNAGVSRATSRGSCWRMREVHAR